MPRLQNRGTTNRAPGTAKEFPAFPNFDPQLEEIDGGATNASFQRWAALMRARLEGNAAQDDGRFKSIQTTVDRADGYLESVWTMQAIAGPVVTGMTLFSSANPNDNTFISRITFQADVLQIQTASGNHKTVFSTSADAIKLGDVLTVDLANAKVYIGTGTYANSNTAFYVDDDGFFSLKNKLTFDPTGLGTLTVTGAIVADSGVIGGWNITSTTLTRNNATLDSAGQLVLGTANDIIYLSATDATYRIWVGNVTAGSATFRVTKTGAISATAGLVGGWTLSSTTLSASNVVIDSSGTILLGTASDILLMSAVDSTYRLWAGNVTASLATFSVTKAGALFSTSGLIGGFTITSTTLTGGSGATQVLLSSTAAAGILVGDPSALHAAIVRSPGNIVSYALNNSLNVQVGLFSCAAAGTNGGSLTVYDSAGSGFINLDGSNQHIVFSSDTNIYRSAAATLKTDGTLVALGYLAGNGLVGTPSIAFSSDPDTGWYWSSSGDMRATTNGVDRFVVRDGAIVCLVPLKIDNNRVAGAPVPGGTVTIQSASGATISLITT